MERIRVAGIGAGYFSQYHYDAWSRLFPSVSLEAICVRSNIERAKELGARYGCSRVYNDINRMLDEVQPDLIDIITTPDSHLELVRAGAQRCIPMISQKPLASSFAEAEEIVAVAENAQTLLIVHENWRFKPWFRETGRLIQSGGLGEIYSVMYRMRPGDGQGASAYLERQPYFRTMPRFLIHETGIHLIDVFRFLMGEMVGVFAYLRRINSGIAGEDAGIVVFQFANGSTGLYDGNRLGSFRSRDPWLTMGEMVVDGEKGYIRLDGDGDIWIGEPGKAETKHDYHWENRNYSGDCVYKLVEHVVRHFTRGEPIENSGRNYLRNLLIEEAIYELYQQRTWIDLPVVHAAARAGSGPPRSQRPSS